MPRHEPVSPEEDLASYYGTAETSAHGGDTPSRIPQALAPSWPADGFDPDPNADPNAVPPGRLTPVLRPAPTFSTPAPVDEDLPSPAIAAILSFLVPGAGQMYAGQTVKGVTLMLVAFVTCFGFGTLNVLAGVDALLIAQRKARGEPVGDWQIF
ncbi:MAG: hypothetical protein Q8P18_03960 [Pseudomonadota bacterium]|nr:hypothetical protein [Pseudomonadota bacterium]